MSASDLEEFREAMSDGGASDHEVESIRDSSVSNRREPDELASEASEANIEFENPFPKDYLKGLEDEFGC